MAELRAQLGNSNKARKDAKWYEDPTAQWLLGMGAAIVLTVVATMVKDLRWLLWPAWLCFILAFFPITQTIASRLTRRMIIAAGVALVTFGLYQLNARLNPELSNEQLCAQVTAYAQRMRDFARERDLQIRQIQTEYDRVIDQAKTDDEQIRLRKQKSDAWTQWFDRRNYDYEYYLMPQAKYYRTLMLLRLPPQPKEMLLNDEAAFLNVGAGGIREAADHLDVWSKMLCPIR